MLRVFTFLFLVAIQISAHAQPRVIEFNIARPVEQKWRVGVVVTATGSASGLQATVPVPMNWPEQKVEILEKEISPNARMTLQTVDASAQQMVVTISRLRAGETARAIVTLKTTTDSVADAKDVEKFKFISSLSSFRKQLVPSPFIESSHRDIQALAKEIVDDSQSPWQQVRAIFDWVQENVEYRQVEDTTKRYLGKDDAKIKGAVAVMKDQFGDCDEMTSLFVALCRANKIPARAVWVIGHAYPEFCLEDASGKPHWYPCEIAGGNKDFGRMPSPKPIMQKGDSFRVPGERKPCRYLRPSLTAKRAAAPPKFELVLERVPAGK